MRCIVLLLSLQMIFAAIGCRESTQTPLGLAPDARRTAFIEYIDGQTISLTADADHVAKKDEIEAVQFSDSAVVKNGIKDTTANFVLDTGQEKYAVHCRVTYHEVEETVAFHLFDVISVEEQ